MAAHKIGLIVNPIAGMGGKTALKGTDGAALSAARARGAKAESNSKAERALRQLLAYRDRIEIFTAAGDMGQSLCEKLGLPYTVIHTPDTEESSSYDTAAAAEKLAAAAVELLLFAGGDGTARDICAAIGKALPVLGIPAGVKIQSAVFALTPEAAGHIAAAIADGCVPEIGEREVVDLDEDAYRSGHVSAALYGMMRVPKRPEQMQCMKQSGFSGEAEQLASIAAYLEDGMQSGVYYAIGSGSSAKCVCARLGVDYELLGIDIVRDRRLVEKDVTEERLWEYAKTGALRIIVSPIGGQGFIFGRGNHQFSARVLHAVGKKNITVVASEAKILSLAGYTLRADCADEDVNAELRGYYNVVSGYGRFALLPCK